MSYSTYILYSESLDRYYVGHSQNVDDRLANHLHNHRGYTARAKDWRVVYSEKFNSREAAYAREREIKKWKSRVKIEHLIIGD